MIDKLQTKAIIKALEKINNKLESNIKLNKMEINLTKSLILCAMKDLKEELKNANTSTAREK